MTTILKRSTLYISPFPRYVCSRPGCTGHGRYGNAAGTRWCGDDWKRHMLVEVMQHCYSADLSLRGAAYQASELMQTIAWIQQASGDEIATVCAWLHVEDVA
jgi:hypothetical protein